MLDPQQQPQPPSTPTTTKSSPPPPPPSPSSLSAPHAQATATMPQPQQQQQQQFSFHGGYNEGTGAGAGAGGGVEFTGADHYYPPPPPHPHHQQHHAHGGGGHHHPPPPVPPPTFDNTSYHLGVIHGAAGSGGPPPPPQPAPMMPHFHHPPQHPLQQPTHTHPSAAHWYGHHGGEGVEVSLGGEPTHHHAAMAPPPYEGGGDYVPPPASVPFHPQYDIQPHGGYGGAGMGGGDGTTSSSFPPHHQSAATLSDSGDNAFASVVGSGAAGGRTTMEAIGSGAGGERLLRRSRSNLESSTASSSSIFRGGNGTSSSSSTRTFHSRHDVFRVRKPSSTRNIVGGGATSSNNALLWDRKDDHRDLLRSMSSPLEDRHAAARDVSSLCGGGVGAEGLVDAIRNLEEGKVLEESHDESHDECGDAVRDETEDGARGHDEVGDGDEGGNERGDLHDCDESAIELVDSSFQLPRCNLTDAFELLVVAPSDEVDDDDVRLQDRNRVAFDSTAAGLDERKGQPCSSDEGLAAGDMAPVDPTKTPRAGPELTPGAPSPLAAITPAATGAPSPLAAITPAATDKDIAKAAGCAEIREETSPTGVADFDVEAEAANAVDAEKQTSVEPTKESTNKPSTVTTTTVRTIDLPTFRLHPDLRGTLFQPTIDRVSFYGVVHDVNKEAHAMAAHDPRGQPLLQRLSSSSMNVAAMTTVVDEEGRVHCHPDPEQEKDEPLVAACRASDPAVVEEESAHVGGGGDAVANSLVTSPSADEEMDGAAAAAAAIGGVIGPTLDEERWLLSAVASRSPEEVAAACSSDGAFAAAMGETPQPDPTTTTATGSAAAHYPPSSATSLTTANPMTELGSASRTQLWKPGRSWWEAKSGKNPWVEPDVHNKRWRYLWPLIHYHKFLARCIKKLKRNKIDVKTSASPVVVFLREEVCAVSDHLATMSHFNSEQWTSALSHFYGWTDQDDPQAEARLRELILGLDLKDFSEPSDVDSPLLRSQLDEQFLKAMQTAREEMAHGGTERSGAKNTGNSKPQQRLTQQPSTTKASYFGAHAIRHLQYQELLASRNHAVHPHHKVAIHQPAQGGKSWKNRKNNRRTSQNRNNVNPMGEAGRPPLPHGVHPSQQMYSPHFDQHQSTAHGQYDMYGAAGHYDMYNYAPPHHGQYGYDDTQSIHEWDESGGYHGHHPGYSMPTSYQQDVANTSYGYDHQAHPYCPGTPISQHHQSPVHQHGGGDGNNLPAPPQSPFWSHLNVSKCLESPAYTPSRSLRKQKRNKRGGKLGKGVSSSLLINPATQYYHQQAGGWNVPPSPATQFMASASGPGSSQHNSPDISFSELLPVVGHSSPKASDPNNTSAASSVTPPPAVRKVYPSKKQAESKTPPKTDSMEEPDEN